MQISLRKMGNSTGMIVPKEMLRQIGAQCGTLVDLRVESGSLIATPATASVRAGWAEDAAGIGDVTGEERDLLDLANDGDAERDW